MQHQYYKPTASLIRKTRSSNLVVIVIALAISLGWILIEPSVIVVSILLGLAAIYLINKRQLECPYCGHRIKRYSRVANLTIECINCSHRSQIDSEEKFLAPLDDLPLPQIKSSEPPRVSAGLKIRNLDIEIQECKDLRLK